MLVLRSYQAFDLQPRPSNLQDQKDPSIRNWYRAADRLQRFGALGFFHLSVPAIVTRLSSTAISVALYRLLWPLRQPPMNCGSGVDVGRDVRPTSQARHLFPFCQLVAYSGYHQSRMA